MKFWKLTRSKKYFPDPNVEYVWQSETKPNCNKVGLIDRVNYFPFLCVIWYQTLNYYTYLLNVKLENKLGAKIALFILFGPFLWNVACATRFEFFTLIFDDTIFYYHHHASEFEKHIGKQFSILLNFLSWEWAKKWQFVVSDLFDNHQFLFCINPTT